MRVRRMVLSLRAPPPRALMAEADIHGFHPFTSPLEERRYITEFDAQHRRATLDALSKLKQTTSVVDYQEAFEDLTMISTGISEPLLLSYYITGLQPVIRRELLLRYPATLMDAFAQACRCEARATHSTSSGSLGGPLKPTTISIPTPIPPAIPSSTPPTTLLLAPPKATHIISIPPFPTPMSPPSPVVHKTNPMPSSPPSLSPTPPPPPSQKNHALIPPLSIFPPSVRSPHGLSDDPLTNPSPLSKPPPHPPDPGPLVKLKDEWAPEPDLNPKEKAKELTNAQEEHINRSNRTRNFGSAASSEKRGPAILLKRRYDTIDQYVHVWGVVTCSGNAPVPAEAPHQFPSAAKAADKVFDEMPGRNVVLWNPIVCNLMEFESNSKPTHTSLIHDGLGLNVVASTALADFHCKWGKISDASQVFDDMPHKSIVSFSPMNYGFASNGFGIESLQSSLDVLKACIYLNCGNLKMTMNLGNLEGHLNLGNVESGMCFFNEKDVKRFISWTLKNMFYLNMRGAAEVLEVFTEMRTNGVSNEVIEELKGDLEEIFKLHSKGKEVVAPLPGGLRVYGQKLVLNEEKLEWQVMLFLNAQPPHARNFTIWPSPIFRSTLDKYSTEFQSVSRWLFDVIAKSLRLNPEVLCGIFNDHQRMWMKYHPPCIQANQVIDINPLSLMAEKENMLRVISAYGFEQSSAIQQWGIVSSIKGLDIIHQAQAGIGRTANWCSDILQQLNCGLLECQVWDLTPIQELAHPIEKIMQTLGDQLGVKDYACVGGSSNRKDPRILSTRFYAVVGTPGRLLAMLRPDHIDMFVLDEAEEMLSCGYKDQICDIYQLRPLPSKFQVRFPNWVMLLDKQDQVDVQEPRHLVVLELIFHWRGRPPDEATWCVTFYFKTCDDMRILFGIQCIYNWVNEELLHPVVLGVFVHWRGRPPEGAAWRSFESMCEQCPILHLEDKVNFKGRRVDTTLLVDLSDSLQVIDDPIVVGSNAGEKNGASTWETSTAANNAKLKGGTIRGEVSTNQRETPGTSRS